MLALLLAAATASQVFTDVPAGHWAEPAVTDVALERHFMLGYPDHTFRGPRPFTRVQLAQAIDPFITELEALSKASWVPDEPPRPAFGDAPPEAAAAVARVAGRYHLFDGMLGGRRFEPEAQVTRYQMASLIDRLLHLGEARHVVDASVLEAHVYGFSDVQPAQQPLVDEVASKYQVMVGFPDRTFRGPEKLTRYQFAAAAAQTFPLVKQLVIKTQIKHNPPPTPTPPPPAAPAPTRFMEDTPLQVGLTGRLNNVIGLGGQVRMLGYEGDAFWLLETKLGVPLCTSELAYAGDLAAGWSFDLGRGVQLAPYVGARLLDVNPALAGGVAYGVLLHQRPAAWGWYVQANGASNLTARGGLPLGATWGGGLAGLEYHFLPTLSGFLEGGYFLWPNTLNAPAGTVYGADGAVSTTVGLSFGW